MSVLISVPAGRCDRRPGTKWVDAKPEKGALELKLDDGLMHFYWKNRVSGAIEDDLIIFPGEATFEKVTQDSTGRTHILKFSSSDQKYFFWFQRKDTTGHARAQVDVNELLQDPSYTTGSAPLPEAPTARTTEEPAAETAASSSAPAEGSSTSTATAAPAEPASSTTNPQAEMARLLMQWAQTSGLPSGSASGSGSGGAHEEASLTDVLSPANITTLINAHPEIVDSLAPHLPPALGLGEKPAAKDVLPILTAPQFSDAIGSLDEALRSGGLPGSVMRELGLPEESGMSVSAFLEALRGLKKEDENSMDTD